MTEEEEGASRQRRLLVVSMLAQLVAACGGGGGDAPVPSAPVPAPPPAPAPIPAGTLSFVAGDLTATGSGVVDGAGEAARFFWIAAMAAGADGNLYVAEQDSVRRVTPEGLVTTIAGKKPADNTAVEGTLDGVLALAVASADRLLVSTHRGIHGVTTAGSITTLVQFPQSGQESDSLPADAIRTAQSLVVDTAGNWYFTDVRLGATPGWRVRKRTADGQVSDVPGGFFPVSFNSTSPQVVPDRLAVDAAGNLYIAVLRKEQAPICAGTCFIQILAAWVQKIAPDGTSTVLAGSMQTVGATDGAGDQARFNHPSDIAADASGNVYVADLRNHAVRRIGPQGQVTTVVGVLPASQGAPAPSTAPGPLPATVAYPSVLAAAPGGVLYIAPGSPIGVSLAQTRNPGRAVLRAEGLQIRN